MAGRSPAPRCWRWSRIQPLPPRDQPEPEVETASRACPGSGAVARQRRRSGALEHVRRIDPPLEPTVEPEPYHLPQPLPVPAEQLGGQISNSPSTARRMNQASFLRAGPQGLVVIASILTDLRSGSCRGQPQADFFSTARNRARNVVIR